jgi:hypothetical protein
VILSLEKPDFVQRIAEAVNFPFRMNHIPFIFMYNREDYAICPGRNVEDNKGGANEKAPT